MALVGGGRARLCWDGEEKRDPPSEFLGWPQQFHPQVSHTTPGPWLPLSTPGQGPDSTQMPSLTELPFSQMLDGGAEPQSSPASRAGVGEGEGEGLARGAGGPGQALGKAGSSGGNPEGPPPAVPSLPPVDPPRRAGGCANGRGHSVRLPSPAPVCAVLSLFSRVLLLATPWTVGYLSRDSPGKNMEGVAIPSSGGSSYPVIKPQPPASPASAGGLFTTRPPGKLCLGLRRILICVFPKPGLSVAGAEGQACESKTSACG